MSSENIDFFSQYPTELNITDKEFTPDLFEMLPYTIPGRPGNCALAPLFMIVRRLTCDQIEKEMNSARQSLNFSESVSVIKEYYVKKDVHLIIAMLEVYYVSWLKELNIDLLKIPDNLVQIVEIDVTMQDLYPGDTEIHYSIYTKRELRILDDDTT